MISNRSCGEEEANLVADPEATSVLVLVDTPCGEAVDVVLQHVLFIVVGSNRLSLGKTSHNTRKDGRIITVGHSQLIPRTERRIKFTAGVVLN